MSTSTVKHASGDIIAGDEMPAPTSIVHWDHEAKEVKNKRLTDTQVAAISGALAGFLSGVTVCPLDVAKTRLQAQGAVSEGPKKYSGLVGTVRTIVKHEGYRGLYKGLGPIVCGYFPTWMIYFTVYEKAKRFYPGFLESTFGIKSEFISHSCSAWAGGAISMVTTNPIWVVKTRLMLQEKEGQYYKGTFDAFRKMYQREGIKVFYSGLIPSLFGLLHVSIHFPVYEQLKIMLDCDTNGLAHLIMASCVSKMCASGLTYPHELLRTRMQIRTVPHMANGVSPPGLVSVIKSIYATEGFLGFYSGFTTNLARTVPASAITLVSFEYIRKYLSKLQ